MALVTPNIVLRTDYKIKTLRDLETEIFQLRLPVKNCSDHKIVLTTGVFDLVHPGHIDYFEKAKAFGDVLVVSVVDDQFVKKGPGRPIFNQALRLSWLAASEIVDFVVLNGDYGPWKVMKTIKPDVYVKGYNLTTGLMEDIATMQNLNGQTILIPEIMHSTEIFSAIRQSVVRSPTPESDSGEKVDKVWIKKIRNKKTPLN